MKNEIYKIARIVGSVQVVGYVLYILVLFTSSHNNELARTLVAFIGIIYMPIHWMFSLLPHYPGSGNYYGGMFFYYFGVPLVGIFVYTLLITLLVTYIKRIKI